MGVGVAGSDSLFRLYRAAAEAVDLYFRNGYDRELGVRRAVQDLMTRFPLLSTWEAHRMADRAWVAYQRSADASPNKAKAG